MKTQADYDALIKELKAVEDKYHFSEKIQDVVYLTDELIDRENVLKDGRKETDPDFWQHMCWVAENAAGMRAEEYGLDINEELGRVVY